MPAKILGGDLEVLRARFFFSVSVASSSKSSGSWRKVPEGLGLPRRTPVCLAIRVGSGRVSKEEQLLGLGSLSIPVLGLGARDVERLRFEGEVLVTLGGDFELRRGLEGALADDARGLAEGAGDLPRLGLAGDLDLPW